MRRHPAPYHTAMGEAMRLETIKAMYADVPECVANAQRTLDKHLAEHPEIAPADVRPFDHD